MFTNNSFLVSLSKQSTTLSVPLHSILSVAVTVKLREHENKHDGVEGAADVQQERGARPGAEVH